MELNDKDLELAFHFWYSNYPHKDADSKVIPFLNSEIKATKTGEISWLKKARTALFLSENNVASKLGISRSAYSFYEKNEARGTITLQSLMNAAEALDCELVYALRPKKKVKFSKIIWKVLFLASKDHTLVIHPKQKLRSHALAAAAAIKMADPKFRRSKKWVQQRKFT